MATSTARKGSDPVPAELADAQGAATDDDREEEKPQDPFDDDCPTDTLETPAISELLAEGEDSSPPVADEAAIEVLERCRRRLSDLSAAIELTLLRIKPPDSSAAPPAASKAQGQTDKTSKKTKKKRASSGRKSSSRRKRGKSRSGRNARR